MVYFLNCVVGIITPTENLEVSWATSVRVSVFLITCVVMACSLALLKRNRAIVCPLYSSNHARMKKQPKTHLKTSQHIDIHIHAQEKNPAVQTSPRHTSAVRSQSDNRPATVLIRSVACDHTLVWQAAWQADRAHPAFRPPCPDRAGSAAGDCPRPWQRWSGWRRAGAAGRCRTAAKARPGPFRHSLRPSCRRCWPGSG